MTLMESFVRVKLYAIFYLTIKVKVEKRVIPTGIELAKFERPEIGPEHISDLRNKLGIQQDEKMLLSLSRVSYEKNIQAVLKALPDVLKEEPNVKLVVAGRWTLFRQS